MRVSFVHRWSDSFWTMVRFVFCLSPALVFAILFYSKFPDFGYAELAAATPHVRLEPHLLYLQQLHHMRQQLFLIPIAVGMLIFSGLQLGVRSPFHNSKMMHWLGIHGWQGSERQLPFRRAVPLAEIFCVAAMIVICGVVAPTGFLLIPWAWLVCRVILQTPRFLSSGVTPEAKSPDQPLAEEHLSAENQPIRTLTSMSTEWKVGLLWSLTAASLLWLQQLWIAVPGILLATGLLHHLTQESFRRLSDTLMQIALPASGPEISSWLPSSRSGISSLFPFYDLRPREPEHQPTWSKAIVVASLTAWVVYCVATATPNLLPIMDEDLQHAEQADLLAMLLCFVTPAISGFVRVYLCAGPRWASRLGPLSRIITGRLVVPSYDRVLKPLLLAVGIGCGALMIPTESWNLPLAVSVFLSILLLQRGSPQFDQWQMTADARLSTALMSNPKPARR